jgi:hypothetical protein
MKGSCRPFLGLCLQPQHPRTARSISYAWPTMAKGPGTKLRRLCYLVRSKSGMSLLRSPWPVSLPTVTGKGSHMAKESHMTLSWQQDMLDHLVLQWRDGDTGFNYLRYPLNCNEHTLPCMQNISFMASTEREKNPKPKHPSSHKESMMSVGLQTWTWTSCRGSGSSLR